MRSLSHIIIWILAAVFIFLLAAAEMLYRQNRSLKYDNNRLSSNQRILTGELTYYKTSDSLSAARIGILRMEKKEMEETNSVLLRNIKDLKIRLKNVEAISAINISNQYKINSQLRDSLKIIRDSLGVPVDTVNIQFTRFKDKWVEFYQEQVDKQISTSIKTRDSIVIVQHWTPYKFLWFKWGKKDHQETVKSYSPYSTVDLVLTIDIQK